MARIRGVVLVAMLLTAMVVAGCGSDDDSGSTSASTGTDVAASTQADTADAALVEAAQKEGKLSWYAGQNPVRAQNVIDGFEKKYGIEVESLRLSGTQLTQRYAADQKTGNPSDVISAAVPQFFEQGATDGWFVKLTPDEVPAAADFPKKYIRYDDTTALISISPFEVVINSDIVSDPPKTWEDVLKPEYKDQIVFPDPRVIPTMLGLTDVWYDELGPDFLEKFAAQNPTIVDSAVPGIQSLASGEKSLLVSTDPSVAQTLIDEGAPLKNVLLTPTDGTEMFMAASADAPHPNAARLMMNFMMSPEGQLLDATPAKYSPLEVEGQDVLPDGYVSVDLDKAAERQDEIFGLLGLG